MTDLQVASYRSKFASADDAVRYENGEYAPGSYGALLWEVEKLQLEQVLKEVASPTERSYLDFACGTGRVASHLEGRFRQCTAVEISAEMLAHARSRLKSTLLVCADLTAPDADLSRHAQAYDVITAFRFLLNAEPALRVAALATLSAFLKGSESILIINNHGNLWSHKAILWPYHRLRARFSRQKTLAGNCLSHSDLVDLLRASGLRVRRRFGCGVLGAKALKFLPYGLLLRLEEWLSQSSLARFGVNQMYVVSRAPEWSGGAPPASAT